MVKLNNIYFERCEKMWDKVPRIFKLPIIAFISAIIPFYFCSDDVYKIPYTIIAWIGLWIYGGILFHAMGIDELLENEKKVP